MINGLMKLAWKNLRSLNQEANSKRVVVVHIMSHVRTDGLMISFQSAMTWQWLALEEIRKTDVDDEVYEDCYHDLLNCLQTHGLEKNWHIKIVELDNFGEV